MTGMVARWGFVGASASGGRVDAAHLEVVAVLAADTRSERQATGCQFGDGGEAAHDRDRVAQGQQVHRHGHR